MRWLVLRHSGLALIPVVGGGMLNYISEDLMATFPGNGGLTLSAAGEFFSRLCLVIGASYLHTALQYAKVYLA
ncbi:hypothetical protein AFLA_009864 [Aspergillus flavus NRRL3357]|nr:hypothetical protein AFLA_009864 [Aspergillus flavus NRRL3357]